MDGEGEGIAPVGSPSPLAGEVHPPLSYSFIPAAYSEAVRGFGSISSWAKDSGGRESNLLQQGPARVSGEGRVRR